MSVGATDADVAIVGAGIVGICVAESLARLGRTVALYDRTGVCDETSSGNAAALAFPEILPLAQKGMLKNLPRWLADPLGPLSIPPAYLPKLAPWLWRFWRAGSARHYEASLSAQMSLMQLAEAEWSALLDRSGTRPMLRETGALELYGNEAEFAAALPGWAARERAGIPFRHVQGGELAALQPGLSPIFVRGTFMPTWRNVADPQQIGKAVFAHAQAGGRVSFERRNVVSVTALEGGAQLRFSDGGEIACRYLVIAAGAWSHRLAAQLGDTIPLETERGYNTTLPSDAFDVKRQLIFSGYGFVITPLDTGLRIGGAVELAGLDRPPNFARARAMLEKSRKFLPGLKAEGGREWMGYRPSLPDSLPVIGRSRRGAGIVYAFGHGHLGLTQAAATGRLVTDLVSGQSPAIDIKPFSPGRF